ncbi:MAG: four helix bundle protein [Flavobacterium sp.]|nr:four helix bundle protein [Flavobacterium sp.]
MRSFKELEIWQESRYLVKEIYLLSTALPPEEKYGLLSQIRRAAISIPSNIAEGAGKDSQKDFARYLQISLGSAYELESHLLLCQDLSYIPENEVVKFVELLNIVQRKIYTFIKYLNR